MTFAQRHWLMRLAFRLYLVLVCALCVLAVVSLLQGDFLRAGVTVGVLLADFVGSAAVAVGIVACLLLGVYAAAVLAAGMVATKLLGRRGDLRRARGAAFDPQALAAATSFPERLRAQLLEASGGGPITTRSMLAAAATREPGAWGPLLGRDPGEGAFDGPLLRVADGCECSQYAAEALGLASVVSEQLARPLDTGLLAAGAATVPLAAASDWLEQEGLPAEAARVSPAQLTEAATVLSTGPAGADLLRRVEIVVRVGARGEGTTREQLATLERGALTKIAGLALAVGFVATIYAYLAVAGELLLGLLRWVLSLPRRAFALPGRAWRALFVMRDEGRIHRRWVRLTSSWADWPAPVRGVWLCGRPLLGLAAFVCVAGFSPLSIWLALPLALTVTAVRSVRWPWLSLVAAAAVSWLSPLGAALLTLRALLGEAVIWRLGRGQGWVGARRRGLRDVITARLDAGGRLIGYPAESLDAARASFATAVEGGDEDTVMECASSYGVAAWAGWHWLELFGLVRRVAHGVLRGHWTGPVENAGLFNREMMTLVLLGELLEFVARWAALGLAAVIAFFVAAGAGGLLGGEDMVGRCAAALATLLVALPLTRREISPTAAVFWSLLAWLALGSGAWEVIAIAVAATFATRALRRLTEVLSFSGRARWHAWPPPKRTPWRLRRHWKAASKALDAGDERLGIEMLKELAREDDAGGAFFAAALGRAALVEIDLGRLQDAAAHLDEISDKCGELEGTAAVATGMLASSLGEFDRAARVLRPALDELDSSSPLVPRATLALSEALARSGDPEGALELIAEGGSRPFALRGVPTMLESQAAIAAALVERGTGRGEDEARAVSLLAEFDVFSAEDDELSLGLGADAKRRLDRAKAQMLALRGQLLLARQPTDAVSYLERAVGLAAGDEALRARAQVLHGSALAQGMGNEQGTNVIVQGVETLETRRVQLRAAERRTAMIGAGETLYSSALAGFLAAQRKGCEEAGIEAAKLVESLRQSALAATLRSGPLPLDPATKGLIERVLAGERTGADVDELRTAVGEQISTRFAAAYLPTSVTIGRLRQSCRDFDHVLAFYVPPSGLPGWRVWITPGGKAEVARVNAVANADSLLSALATSGKLPDEQIHLPLTASVEAWERLGEELLPLEMRKDLLRADRERPRRVLVVPDGALSLVPWAALRIGGRPLVESAVVQAVPALELAGSTVGPAATEGVIAHLPSDEADAELRQLRDRGAVEVATTRDAFLSALDSGQFEGAYMASHGDQVGLRQQIEFADGSRLSAASALGYRWPAWTVFSSCLVGRVEQVAGREPFGLAISCMLRGADTVVASVVELSEEGAQACGEATASLADARDPGRALREAQLRQLKQRRLASLADGLGLVCVTTRAPGA